MRPTRLVELDDAPVLAELLRSNRAHLAPWEPDRPADQLTVDGQRAMIRDLRERYEQGTALPHVILDGSGGVVGRITLSEIVRGPFQSASLGYWLAEAATGRGLATAAVREIERVAFEELGLHRIQAGTLLHNVRSQRVLDRAGFVRYGIAPAYLHIAGEWRDHALYQVLAE
jgi:ribosomal-protein-alanine N-acetyltransferase